MKTLKLTSGSRRIVSDGRRIAAILLACIGAACLVGFVVPGARAAKPTAPQQEHEHNDHERLPESHAVPDGTEDHAIHAEDEKHEHDGHGDEAAAHVVQDGMPAHNDPENHDDHEAGAAANVSEADDEHEESEDDHEDEEVVRLSDAELREFGITLATADAGTIKQQVKLPGEVVLNDDHVAHVVPRVAGIVKDVRATVGDQVEKGQVLAVLESRELAEAKALYLAVLERETLARENFKREEGLWENKVTSEQEYLDARQALAEARIARNSAEQKLHALGCTENDLRTLNSSDESSLTHYTVIAPFSGTIVEKHATLGEKLSPEADAFTIADLSTVWVNLTVYQRDLAHVRAGQPVEIKFSHGIPDTDGKIAFVSPALDEATRTAYARIVLSNPEGHWRPGLFVEGVIETGHDTAAVVVPRSAVIGMDGQQVVFVDTGEGLAPHPVQLGRETEQHVEIMKGLQPGQRYAATGVLTLKAQMNSAALDSAGHAH